jgi:uncharacterized membrane protein YbhN (UPF0104 family)
MMEERVRGREAHPRPRPEGRRCTKRRLLRPGVIIPATLSIGLLAALLTFGNARAIVADIAAFHPVDLLWYLVFALLYELGRGMQWLFLVGALRLRVTTREKILSFLTGEVTKSLPFGNYFPNYILQQAEGVDFGRSSAVTTAIVLFEVAVTLTGLVLLGLGSWTGWLRPLILAGVPVFLALAWLVHRLWSSRRAPKWMVRARALRRLLEELAQFRQGALQLWNVPTIAIGYLICSAYVLAAGGALYWITRGLGVRDITFTAVVAVYCFSLAFALIEPSPVDLGITEIGGAGAFVAIGLSSDRAISAMLLSRMLSVAVSLVLAGIGMLLLRREFLAVLRGGQSSRGALAEPPTHEPEATGGVG